MLLRHPGCRFREVNEIEEENWKEKWEQTIHPQQVGQFLVKPTWSDALPQGDSILLEIDPKMAFGTSYHETTRLALRQLSEISFKGKRGMDAGTGTGILAIAAVKLGAAHVTGFEMSALRQENAMDKIYLDH